MKSAIRVLVVDDSALMRQMVSRFLTEAGFEVVGIARNGRIGLEQALALKPDVITLDVEMPEMNGLEMLQALMDQAPTPVVMLSSLTQEQAPVAIEALTLGAVDVVGKPGGQISLNLEEVRDELIRKVRVAAGVRVRRRIGRRRPVIPPGRRATPVPTAVQPAGPGEGLTKASVGRPRGIVVFGCSTGGPGALSEVIPQLPPDFPWAVLVIQHMPPGFTASLARRLDASSALRVAEGRSGVKPQAGQVWIAPGGKHLVLATDGTMQLNEDPPIHGVRPAVDPALITAGKVWGAATIAVIMTGMGRDGARGAQAVQLAGGHVIAQDEATSVVYGMPRVAVELGVVHQELPLSEIVPAVQAQVATKTPSRQKRWRYEQ